MVIDRDSLDRLASDGFGPIGITRTDMGVDVVVADVTVRVSAESQHIVLRTGRPVVWASDDLDPELVRTRANQLVTSIALRATDITAATLTPDLDRLELTSWIAAAPRTPEDLVIGARNLAVLAMDTVGALAALEVRLTQDALGRRVLDDLDPFAATPEPLPDPPPPPAPAQPVTASAPPAADSDQATLLGDDRSHDAPPDPPPAAGQAAGWYPDPRSEARWRWFDGARWTEHTSD